MEEETAAQGAGRSRGRQVRALLRRHLSPRLGAALVLWRVEAYMATPLALLLIATLGRWPAALAMGSVMAVYAAAFLFLLEGQPLLADLHAWARQRRLGRLVEGLAARPGPLGAARRALAVPLAIMFVGPFWRAVTFHLFRLPRLPAYTFSVGGSIPHSLLWTGLILGGLWESVVWPFLRDRGL